jgi:hypothetical protein
MSRHNFNVWLKMKGWFWLTWRLLLVSKASRSVLTMLGPSNKSG